VRYFSQRRRSSLAAARQYLAKPCPRRDATDLHVLTSRTSRHRCQNECTRCCFRRRRQTCAEEASGILDRCSAGACTCTSWVRRHASTTSTAGIRNRPKEGLSARESRTCRRAARLEPNNPQTDLGETVAKKDAGPLCSHNLCRRRTSAVTLSAFTFAAGEGRVQLSAFTFAAGKGRVQSH